MYVQYILLIDGSRGIQMDYSTLRVDTTVPEKWRCTACLCNQHHTSAASADHSNQLLNLFDTIARHIIMPPAQTTQPESSSRTLTQTATPARGTGPNSNDAGPSEPVGVLKLRGGPSRRQKVVWSEETVDNEGMGKKKSKSR